MEINQRTSGDVQILGLEGRFDAYEVVVITDWFNAHPYVNNVVINMSGVGFIDSSGLSSLVKGLKHCRENGGELYLCNLQQAVRIIFELTRLDRTFDIFDNEATALAQIIAQH